MQRDSSLVKLKQRTGETAWFYCKMEMASETTAVKNDWTKGLEKQRQEAVAKVICQEFYQSDRVKSFHRALLHSEALKERDGQVAMKQRLIRAVEEETRKTTASLRRKELESAEQEREKGRRKEREKAAFQEFLIKQVKEQGLRRKMEGEKEVEKCQKEYEQYERERKMLSEKKKEKKMMARKAYAEHLLAMSSLRELEAEKLKMEEERRRFFNTEKDKRVMREQERKAERRRAAQRYRERVAEQLAAEMEEKAQREGQLQAQILAHSLAKREAELQRKRVELEEKRRSMREAIAAHRENNRRVRESRAEDEGRSARGFLSAGKERDRASAETQRAAARREAEKRAAMGSALRRQITERRHEDRLRERQQAELDRKYAELVAVEEEQYQHYTDGFISAAKAADRNTFPLLRAAQSKMWSGVGPMFGGMRANYLVPGTGYNHIPNYISSTTKDLQKLYGAEGGQSAARLRFIW